MIKTKQPGPRLYGDEHHGMSQNESIFEQSATGGHPAKTDDEWERDLDDGVDEGAHAEDDDE